MIASTRSSPRIPNSRSVEITPVRLAPWQSMASPNTVTSTAPTPLTALAKRFPSAATIEPKPSISGKVPRPKTSIRNPPVKGLPEASARICMDWSGPQGMKPFSSPIRKGLVCFAAFWPRARAAKRGRRIVRFRSPGNNPSKLMPMMTMYPPAISFRLPWSAGDTPNSPPPSRKPTSPSTAPMTV